MAFLYETHLHTKEGSACSGCPAYMHVRRYKELGYTGIFVTDHFFNGNTAVNRDQSWEGKVKDFVKGFRHAKEEGDRVGLDVFFGWESGYEGTDFLIYGLDEDWLLAHPEIETCSVERQYELVKESDGYVIHAHPFREESYIKQVKLFPNYVDGVEVVNHGNNRRSKLFNERALEYALANDLPMTEGSDCHGLKDVVGGMFFEERIQDAKDFGRRVVNKEGYSLQSLVEN